jgi:hypothetical protein
MKDIKTQIGIDTTGCQPILLNLRPINEINITTKKRFATIRITDRPLLHDSTTCSNSYKSKLEKVNSPKNKTR